MQEIGLVAGQKTVPALIRLLFCILADYADDAECLALFHPRFLDIRLSSDVDPHRPCAVVKMDGLPLVADHPASEHGQKALALFVHVEEQLSGILAKKLIQIIAPQDVELQGRAFTAGLLHDLGKLIEENYLHEEFEEILELAQEKQGMLIWAEKENIGTTHEEIGSHLAEWWSMPSFLVNAIRWHHSPSLCNAEKEIIDAVHVADALVQQFQVGASGNFCPVKIDRESWERFELSDERAQAFKEEVEQAMI